MSFKAVQAKTSKEKKDFSRPWGKTSFLSIQSKGNDSLPDNRVYFQDFNSLKNNFAEISNYRNFVFQIWPKLNYESHKEYAKQIKLKPKLEKMIKKDPSEIQMLRYK